MLSFSIFKTIKKKQIEIIDISCIFNDQRT